MKTVKKKQKSSKPNLALEKAIEEEVFFEMLATDEQLQKQFRRKHRKESDKALKDLDPKKIFNEAMKRIQQKKKQKMLATS